MWLEARTAVRESEGKPAGLDLQEIAALRWAIDCVQSAALQGMIDESKIPNLQEIAVQDRLQKSGTGL